MGIPSATSTDADDVAWGLQTAEALWKRGEHTDAIVWLRRAASAAGDTGDDGRALELARAAAELTDWHAAAPGGPADVEPKSMADVDEPTVVNAAPLTVDAARTSVDATLSSVEVVPMSTPRAIPPPLPSRRPPPLPPRSSHRPPPPLPSSLPPPPAPSRPPPALPRQIVQMHAEEPAQSEGGTVESLLDESEFEETVHDFESGPERELARALSRGLDLDDVEAFADLPDDTRADFSAAAVIDDLDEGEESSRFALAYVMDGAFDVAATMVDAPAVRMGKGAVLRSRGTTEEGIPIRMICAHGPGRLATWSDAAVGDAFRSAPWVEEELRICADHVQALVGITIGPLGERIDAAIRDQIVGPLTMRALIPGEVIVEAGLPVPGLVLVGVGQIEIVCDGTVTGTVGSGEFVFPSGVLDASAAPGTIRAGVGGALILFGDRKVTHELLMTCPPLVELLAGE